MKPVYSIQYLPTLSIVTAFALSGCALDASDEAQLGSVEQALSESQCNDAADVDETGPFGFSHTVERDDPLYYNGDCGIGYVVDVDRYDARYYGGGTTASYDDEVPPESEGGCEAAFVRAISFVWNTGTGRWDLHKDRRASGNWTGVYCQLPAVDTGLGPNEQDKKVRIAVTARITNTGQEGMAAKLLSKRFF